jgi:hypothetical protein
VLVGVAIVDGVCCSLGVVRAALLFFCCQFFSPPFPLTLLLSSIFLFTLPPAFLRYDARSPLFPFPTLLFAKANHAEKEIKEKAKTDS